MSIAHDAEMMHRAIRIAMNGRGRVEPNPMVGCIIEKNGRVIGEGYHQKFGEAHAEPNALAACTESPAGATAYVTLEPCCHLDKQTPPCVPRLIEAGIARVVVGCLDPNPAVNGKGIAELCAAGIEVNAPCLEADAKQLIAPFIARVTLGRPYVTLKWAQTADGKIAGAGGKRLQISGPETTRAVHELRARSDAILIGINTALMDDPMLVARNIEDARPLMRMVLDRHLRIPLQSKLAQTAARHPLIIFSETGDASKRSALLDLGVHVGQMNPLTLEVVMEATRNINHLLVEPGPSLARSFFDSGLVDRVWIIRSPKRVNDDTAPAAAPVPEGFVVTQELNLGDDVLTEYLNPDSPVFFAPLPSADIIIFACKT